MTFRILNSAKCNVQSIVQFKVTIFIFLFFYFAIILLKYTLGDTCVIYNRPL